MEREELQKRGPTAPAQGKVQHISSQRGWTGMHGGGESVAQVRTVERRPVELQLYAVVKCEKGSIRV